MNFYISKYAVNTAVARWPMAEEAPQKNCPWPEKFEGREIVKFVKKRQKEAGKFF
jgi:hypothetical protein